jgi:predicted RNA binding protein with dsRBD fold (UPF0201 family)
VNYASFNIFNAYIEERDRALLRSFREIVEDEEIRAATRKWKLFESGWSYLCPF